MPQSSALSRMRERMKAFEMPPETMTTDADRLAWALDKLAEARQQQNSFVAAISDALENMGTVQANMGAILVMQPPVLPDYKRLSKRWRAHFMAKLMLSMAHANPSPTPQMQQLIKRANAMGLRQILKPIA